MEFTEKKQYNFIDLIEVIKVLRGEDGCPWDREQTHESLKKGTLEEVYEVLEAIDKKDSLNLREELGDMLLHVVFHADIAKDNKTFTIDEVIHNLVVKLIRRHPHVFGEKTSKTSKEVIESWEQIKKKEKEYSSMGEELESIPSAMPSLLRACKVQKKAAKYGFDFITVEDALDKLNEEIEELREAVQKNKNEDIDGEFGDILFSIVNISRFFEINPEICLTNSTKKFINRFKGIENLANKKGIDFNKATLEQLDQLWDEVKKEKQ